MSQAFYTAIQARRSIYALGNKVSLSDDAIVELVKKIVKECPSAFNSQSSRVIVLFGAHHQKLWSIVKDALRAILPAEAFAASEKKIDGCFAAGAGTVLFFEDKDAISKLQAQFPTYAAAFPGFSANSTGMAQFAVWTALAQENIGATLQHYGELIQDAVAKEWDVPSSWQLIAQMPFGSIASPAQAKEYIPDEQRFKVFQ